MTVPASRRAVCGLGFAAAMGLCITCGCASEPVGHTKTVEKTTVETPAGTTTTTEMREKDTKIIDRP